MTDEEHAERLKLRKMKNILKTLFDYAIDMSVPRKIT